MSAPLVVDLDGTLTPSDMLVESFFNLLAETPTTALAAPLWLAREGKAGLKRQLAERSRLDISHLPFNQSLLEWLQAEKASGRPLVLATASDRKLAEQINQRLDSLFDDILASDGNTNLAGEKKAQALISRYGEGNFDYAGNAAPDLKVWKYANRAIVVNPSPGLKARAEQVCTVEKTFDERVSPLKTWAHALRLHQWIKNILLFVPLLTAQQLTNSDLLLQAIIAFFAFGCCASSVYLLNDLLDLPHDRRHHRKRKRPIPSGALNPIHAMLAVPLLLIISGLLVLTLPLLFGVSLLAYYLLTLAYSLVLKRMLMIDVLSLAGLYTMRIIAGSYAIALVPSFWLLAFSMFIFLSLALVKRYTELMTLRQQNDDQTIAGRSYHTGDIELLASLGGSAGYTAVLVMALYINSETVAQAYSHPMRLWLLCPIMLFWISRIWILAHRGRMHDDPIVFAIRDRTSLVLGALMAITLTVAI